MSERRSLEWYAALPLDPRSDAVRQVLSDMVRYVAVDYNMEIMGGYFDILLARLSGPDALETDWIMLLREADEQGYGPALWIDDREGEPS